MVLGLVEMTSGLVNATFSLPEWQAVNMIFFAPWNFKNCYLSFWYHFEWMFYNTESKFEHPGSTYPPKTYLSTPTPQGQSRMGEGLQESSLS